MIRKYQSNLEACVLSFEFLNVNNKDGIGLWNNAWGIKAKKFTRSFRGDRVEVGKQGKWRRRHPKMSKASGEGDITQWASKSRTSEAMEVGIRVA